MAHTKAKGSSKLGRDSKSKRLGVKLYGGQKTKSGEIIVRQRGTKFFSGSGTATASDDTIYAKKAGIVSFNKENVKRFSGKRIIKTVIKVA